MKKNLRFKRWLMAGAMSLLAMPSLFAQVAPQPNYVRDCMGTDPVSGECNAFFSNNAGIIDVQSLAVDKKSKLWIAFYKGGIAVRKPDGTPYELTSDKLVTATTPAVDRSLIKQIKFKTFTDNAIDVTAVGRAIDGNILAVVNSTILYKLDAITGEPLARYVAPVAMVGLTTTSDGRIYMGGVTSARSIIVKQSTTDPTTFDVVEDFVIPNRFGFASRSTTISPSGNKIFYSGENTTLSINVKNEAGVWEAGGSLTFPNITRASRAIDENHLFTVSSSGTDAPATLNYHDLVTPANSWVQPLTEVRDAATNGTKDLRGLAFTPGFDTVYVGSAFSGNIYRYISKPATDPGPVVIGEILPTYKRDCLERNPTTGECVRFFGDNFALSAADFQAVAVDKKSKLWIALYGTGIAVRKPDGTKYQLTSPNLSYGTAPSEDLSLIKQIRFNGFTDNASNVRSIGTAHDGNILVIVRDNILYKLDAVTGEPLARWQSANPVSLAAVSSSADGMVLLHSVLGSDNKTYILKQSTTNPATFDVLKDAFELTGRIGFASRSNSFSPDGNTIFVSSETTTVNVHERNAEGNFVPGQNIITTTNSKKAYAVDNLRVITLHDPFDGTPENPVKEPAALRLHTRADINSPWETKWTLHLKGMNPADKDLRGLAFTRNLDTVYVGSYATGAIYRYVAQTPTTYTIAQVRPVNAQGTADKVGEYVKLTGVVNTENMSADGYNFVMIENGTAIQVFNETKGGMTYMPTLGDNIEAIGTLVQNKGMLQLNVDYIKVLGTGVALTAPKVITSLTEADEAKPVRLERVTLVNPAQWTTGQGAGGFTVQVMKGNEMFDVFIPSTSSLYNMAAPTGEIELDGILMQSKDAAPFTSGYFIMPRSAQDVKYASVGTLADVQWCVGETNTLPIYAMGANPAAAVVRVEMSDATGSFATPRVIGTYNGTGGGTVTTTVPQVANGNGYRLRLVLENPELTYVLPQSLTVTNTPVANFSVAGDVLTATEGQTYQWYYNGATIAAPLGTAREYTATQGGMYKVEVKMNDCSAMSAERNVNVTAIRRDAVAQAVKLYPVPTTGELFLQVPEAIRTATHVQVTDLAGRTVVQADINGSETVALDLSAQPAGVYLVVMETPQGKIVRRVVKQ